MELALLGDSHIPSREPHIPNSFLETIRSVDHVIHTGDFDSKGALADAQDLAPALTAVHGNMDPQIGLPTVATVEVGGVEFVVTHGTGSRGGWEQRVADAVAEHATTDDAVGVAGHTHELTDTVYDGVRILNPGSVTGANPADRPTMVTVTAEDGDLDVTVHEL
ncbi:metallophosphoesterase family protein [Halovenus salina]|uniref:Phosphoesterase n=1 Tax=Halovenus salina TaxID=1510225 RepID=A0ABD5W1D8_9EURY|nr:metallophosphoesterase family protein [Halovenus salina]